MTIALSDITDLSHNYRNASEALTFAIDSLESALTATRYSFKGTSRAYLEMRRDMPYAIHETSLPNTHILVNRNYKPLGSNIEAGSKYVIYEDFNNLHVHLTQSQIVEVANRHQDNWLFGDENPPWRDRTAAKTYIKRLKLLLALLNTEASHGAINGIH
jgi:hypothetical protein